MKFLIRNILCLVLILSMFSVLAQDDIQIKISKKKIVADGKYFYSHVVKKCETLIAISKAYNVLQKDIVMENPDALKGVKPNMVLKIPVFEDKSKFIYHTIEKGQTLYSVAKKYNIDVSILQKNNPAIENGLKIGMELKIPKSGTENEEKNTTKIKEKANKNNEIKKDSIIKKESKIEKKKESENKITEKQINHIVEKGQTIYSLRKKYHVSEEQLKEANPELKERGLKVGETIIIPVPKIVKSETEKTEKKEQKENKPIEIKKEPVVVEPKKQEEKIIIKEEPIIIIEDKKEVKKEDIVIKKDTLQVSATPINTNCAGFDYKNYKKPFKIAMLAPFYIAQNRGYVLKGKKKEEEPPIYPKSLKFIEFYQGMLLALDSLKREGISTELLIYDTERDSAKIAAITQKPEFADVDLIVGPFFSANLKHFSDFAKNNKIPIVSPLSQNADFLANNPFAFQANPSNNTLIVEAANHFSDSKDVNFIVVTTGKKEDSLLTLQFKNKLFEFYNIKFKIDPPHYKDLIYKTAGFKGIQESLNKEIDNVIFIPSVSETTVAGILNKLNTLETKYPIYILGMQSWALEGNIEQDYLFNLQYTYFTSMHVDYNKTEVHNFLNQYRSTYYADPTKYSFQGYDITTYFIHALKTYGHDFTNCIAGDTQLNKKGLQTEFLFNKPNITSGFENTKSFIIQYDKEYNILNINAEKSEIKE